MSWFNDMLIISLAGMLNIVLAIVLGVYWLKKEAFPWEKNNKKFTDEKEGEKKES